MNLDAAIRTACEKNVGLTLWRTGDGRWQAGVTRDRVSWRTEMHNDPVDAILAVCGVETKQPEKGVFD